VRVIEGGADRGPIVSAGIAAGALGLLMATTLAGLPTAEVAMVVAALVVVAVGYRTLLRWHLLIASMLLVILFVPIKFYELPGNLPFDFEPYRVSVMLIVGGWITSLLVDPRVRLRKSGLEAPLAVLFFGTVGSVLVNGPRIDRLGVGPEVVKALMFLASFLLVFYLIVSVIRTYAQVRLLVQVLVAGGAVVSFFALVEASTGFNAFNHLATFIPLLKVKGGEVLVGEALHRGGRLRVFASSQGPIPLGAALVMLLPLALCIASTSARKYPWWIATALIGLGALSTGSRTSVVMMLVVAIVFLWLRPLPTRRALAVLLLPALVGVHVVLPGTVGSLRASFFPSGGLIAEQSQNPGYRGSGRLADVGPTIDEWVAQPLLGQGYGTRITGRSEKANALILDNQWLKTLVETGAISVFGWLWLFQRFKSRLGPAAKADQGDRGWMMTAIAASVIAFSIGMFFYDAFAFIQVTFLLYILLALGTVLVDLPGTPVGHRRRRRLLAPPPPDGGGRPRERELATAA
jgi:polysaccharide biosynthesis protein PslJ